MAFLASDALEGRAVGSAGNDSAAAFLAARYAALGLTPLAPAFQQRFVVRSQASDGPAATADLSTQNVVALLPGRDPVLRGEYVVIGAHFDHLGRSRTHALDPEAGAVIRHGADDNASGTAAVLELARLFARHPPRRSLLFVNFSAEEIGLLGSAYFVAHAPVPVDSIDAMLNFDMVGRLREDRLRVYGVGSAAELAGIVRRANIEPPLAITGIDAGLGPSDHASFYLKRVPVLHFFTDVHPDYHTARDRADRVNAHGEARVVALAERIARDLADRPTRLAFVGTETLPGPIGAARRAPPTVYLGGIPDVRAGEGLGVRVAEVHQGSPADRGGLRAGDVITGFNGKPVADFYAYNDLLYTLSPGDVLQIALLRDGHAATVTVTLGRRDD
ncbi:MAG: M20/M25/M40 family metallo-hydrolase [Gemmatimonadaceae bacterium]